MSVREEIAGLVEALNERPSGARIRLTDGECTLLAAVIDAHPEVWPVGIADTLVLLQRKLRWEDIDRHAIPEPLLAFFDEKFRRDLDPMAMARAIGCEISAGCDACGCRC